MKQLNNKKHIIIGLLALVLAALVILVVYNIIDQRYPKEMETEREYMADIETPVKEWLNGHLGVFFRFKQLGNINWLVIPLLIWFLVTRRKRKEKPEPWQLALIFVWLILVVFIGFKGYDNVRYQMTLFPFTAAMVLFLSWQFLADKSKSLKILFFSFITLVCLFNIYHYFDLYKKYWDLRVSVSKPYFPHQLMDYLKAAKDINKRSRVLTINQPIFYYHIPKKGVDYVSPHAIKVWVEFKKRISTVNNRHNLYRFLKNRLKVKYILLSAVHKRFRRSTMLEEFLHCECKQLIEDHGWLLYRLRDNPLQRTIMSRAYKRIKVWNNKLPLESLSSVEIISPCLLTFSKRGEYRFRLEEKQKEKFIAVRHIEDKKPEKNLEKRIQFGYELNRKGLDVPTSQYEGKYITLIVRASVSPELLNRDNYIAVVDYNKDGSREAEKVFFTSHHWRTYMVSKRVRPDNKRLLLMFRFCPQSTEDRFRIKDVKVVVAKEPL